VAAVGRRCSDSWVSPDVGVQQVGAGQSEHGLAEPAGDVIAAARVIGVLVRNIAVGRRPIYRLSAWAAGHDPGLLGLDGDEAAALNDDRVGRAVETRLSPASVSPSSSSRW